MYEISRTTLTSSDMDAIRKRNNFFWDTNENALLETISLPFYRAYLSDENCQLFGDASNLKASKKKRA